MTHVALHTPDTALWHALVGEAEAASGCTLGSETEGYLVTTLMRFLGKMGNGSEKHHASMDLLDDFLDTGRLRYGNIQEVADQCLIYAGLFPDYADQKKLPINHFVELGRGAYAELAGSSKDNLYAKLSHDFVKLIDVLQSLRELDDGYCCLAPMQAYELWASTGSRNAKKALESFTGSVPVRQDIYTIH